MPAADEKPLRETRQDLPGKILFFGGLFLAIASLGIGFWLAVFSKDYFEARTVLMPAEQQTSVRRGILDNVGFGSLGGLMNLGLEEDKVDISLAVLRSRKFTLDFLERHRLAAPLMAGIQWNRAKDTWLFDGSIYSDSSGEWIINDGKGPTWEEIYDAFWDITSVSQDKSTGFVTLLIRLPSPEPPVIWSELLIRDLNDFLRNQDIAVATSNIEFLNEEIGRATFSEMRQMLFRLVEQELKTVMLARTEKDYAFSVVDPPITPQEPTGPNRLLIIVTSVFLSIAFVLSGLAGKRLFPISANE